MEAMEACCCCGRNCGGNGNEQCQMPCLSVGGSIFGLHETRHHPSWEQWKISTSWNLLEYLFDNSNRIFHRHFLSERKTIIIERLICCAICNIYTVIWRDGTNLRQILSYVCRISVSLPLNACRAILIYVFLRRTEIREDSIQFEWIWIEELVARREARIEMPPNLIDFTVGSPLNKLHRLLLTLWFASYKVEKSMTKTKN